MQSVILTTQNYTIRTNKLKLNNFWYANIYFLFLSELSWLGFWVYGCDHSYTTFESDEARSNLSKVCDIKVFRLALPLLTFNTNLFNLFSLNHFAGRQKLSAKVLKYWFPLKEYGWSIFLARFSRADKPCSALRESVTY